jgi:hypothetical protein
MSFTAEPESRPPIFRTVQRRETLYYGFRGDQASFSNTEQSVRRDKGGDDKIALWLWGGNPLNREYCFFNPNKSLKYSDIQRRQGKNSTVYRSTVFLAAGFAQRLRSEPLIVARN